MTSKLNKSSSFIRLAIILAFTTERATESYLRLPALPARDVTQWAASLLERIGCTLLTTQSDLFAVRNLGAGKRCLDHDVMKLRQMDGNTV